MLWGLLVRHKVDGDQDGVVSRDEVDSAINRAADQFFEKLDTDGDHLLAQSELPERVWERLSRFDANGDAALSAEELPPLHLPTPLQVNLQKFAAHLRKLRGRS